MPIIFITGNRDVPMSVQGMKAAAVEFLTPSHSGTMYSSARTECHRAKSRNASATAGDSCVTRMLPVTHAERREAMTLVVSGLLNKQVAGERGISEITVQARRSG